MIAERIPVGTIAVLHKGEIHPDLDDWLCGVYQRWPYLPKPYKVRGNQIARQRNVAVEDMVGSWLLFVDSDTVPPMHALPRLLDAHHGIVGGVVLHRAPCEVSPGDWRFPVAATRLVDGAPRAFMVEDLTRDVTPCYTVGTALLLIRHQVLVALRADGQPVFRCGQLDPQYLDEDSDFCLRAAALGFTPHLDGSVRAGHDVSALVWPGEDGHRYVQWGGIGGPKERIGDLDGVPR